MSLATRCPACGTVFRVVQDQLKVSEGWVRCGRCAEVFNAVESLVEIDADSGLAKEDAAPSLLRQRVLDDLAGFGAPAAAALTDDGVAWPQGPMASTAPGDADAFDPGRDALTDHGSGPFRPEAATGSASASAMAPAAPPRRQTETSEAAAAPHAEAPDRTPAAGIEPAAAAAAEPTPGFVRRAERAQRWRRPKVRSLLGVAALVAMFVLLAQVAVEYRDTVAARWPASRLLLDALCGVSGCVIEPLRQLGSLVVENSALARIEGTSLMRLSVQLRNRDQVELMLPALDLVLNDVQGRVLARRVLRAAELGASAETLAGGAQLPLSGTLVTGERAVVGYTIEIFYP